MQCHICSDAGDGETPGDAEGTAHDVVFIREAMQEVWMCLRMRLKNTCAPRERRYKNTSALASVL